MQQRLIFLLAIFLSVTSLVAQQLPVGTCGVVNMYDAAGNRTRRVYLCNNGSVAYPLQQSANTQDKDEVIKKNEIAIAQEVDALFPNPTTGKFFVTFSKLLINANVSITDNTGKVLTQFKGNGSQLEFDLSPFAAGMYFIRIEENGKWITKKVIKQ
jgi:hypothetical protein